MRRLTFSRSVRFTVQAQKTHSSQPLPFSNWPWRALCQGQTLSESSWVATNHVQIVHIWPWSICKSCTFLLGITSCATARRASLVAAKARFLGSAALEDTEMPNHDPKSMPRHCWTLLPASQTWSLHHFLHSFKHDLKYSCRNDTNQLFVHFKATKFIILYLFIYSIGTTGI